MFTGWICDFFPWRKALQLWGHAAWSVASVPWTVARPQESHIEEKGSRGDPEVTRQGGVGLLQLSRSHPGGAWPTPDAVQTLALPL